MSSPNERHMAQLDGLRALAVLSVIADHNTPLSGYARFSIGRAAVWLFFVLSGFLITGILLKARDDAARVGRTRGKVWFAFWVRRVVRIFPLFYASLIAVAWLGLAEKPADLPWYFLFLSNYRAALDGGWAPAIGHFWSLAVEEQFYILWPALILFAPRRWLFPTAVTAVALAPATRMVLYGWTHNIASSMTPTPACLDGLGMGALLALMDAARDPSAPELRRPRARVVLLGLGMLGAILASRYLAEKGWSSRGTSAIDVAGFAAEYFALSLISFWLVGRASGGFAGLAGRTLQSWPFVAIGRVSYGIYVLHLMVPELIEKAEHAWGVSLHMPAHHGLARAGYVAAASTLLATISWFVLERPMNDLKRYFPYVPRTKAPRAG